METSSSEHRAEIIEYKSEMDSLAEQLERATQKEEQATNGKDFTAQEQTIASLNEKLEAKELMRGSLQKNEISSLNYSLKWKHLKIQT